jgi:2-methylcitrate dehydratase PrpD
MTGSLTRRLLASLWDREFDDADAAAARRLLLDHIAVAAWGSQIEAGELMRAHVMGDLDGGEPTLPLIGTSERASATAASMANAVAAAAYEFDDTHTGASVHPGAVIFPAAMAAATIAGSDTQTFLRSVIIGYEVMCRVGRAAGGPAHRARHFHPTSTTGHFGAAAAAATCLGLDVDASVAALTLSGTMAGGSMQFLVDGSNTKQVHPAFAVQRGVQAAQLAARGFPGVADPIGGERAFLAAQSADPHPERILAGLGEVASEIVNTGIKPYPSCRNTQTPLDALLAVRAEHDLRPEDVVRVQFGLIEPGVATIYEPVAVKRRPTSLVDAQFSMPFVAAIAILHGEVTPALFTEERYAAPEVLALADRVECVHDPELDRSYPAHWPAWVRIETGDGGVLTGQAEDPRGDPANPLSDAELSAKFRSLTDHAYGRRQQEEVESAVATLGATTSLAGLVSTLQSTGDQSAEAW